MERLNKITAEVGMRVKLIDTKGRNSSRFDLEEGIYTVSLITSYGTAQLLELDNGLGYSISRFVKADEQVSAPMEESYSQWE